MLSALDQTKQLTWDLNSGTEVGNNSFTLLLMLNASESPCSVTLRLVLIDLKNWLWRLCCCRGFWPASLFLMYLITGMLFAAAWWKVGDKPSETYSKTKQVPALQSESWSAAQCLIVVLPSSVC